MPLLVLVSILPASSLAALPANDAFDRTWERTERPVTDRVATRTWMWGPEARTGAISEPYLEAPDGYREVQYFDKTRMEINDPQGDADSTWYITNGLLAWEMITGRIQLGHLSYADVGPAGVQIAGDPHPDSPTYASLTNLLNEPAIEPGTIITTQLTGNGDETHETEPSHLTELAVETAYYVPETQHTIAVPFWEFMNSSGQVREDGASVHGQLFPDPFFATGFPITEAYWANVPVGGEWRDVLLQCFERRCLTYTPENPEGWQVETGNIGLHYHEFRYGQAPEVLDCIDLNLATVPDLSRVTNIGEARARDILGQRPFESVDDLERVSGIGPVTVQRIVDQGLACVVYDFADQEFYRN